MTAVAANAARPRHGSEPTLRAAAPAVIAVVVAGLAAVSAVVGRGALAPLFDLTGVRGQVAAPLPAAPTPQSAAPSATPSTDAAAIRYYTQQIAPTLEEAYRRIGTVGTQILEDTAISGPERAHRLRTVVLPALVGLISSAEQVRTGIPAIDGAHAHLLAALRAAHSGYAAEADYGQTGNPYTQVQAASDRLAALSAWRAWRAYLVILDGN